MKKYCSGNRENQLQSRPLGMFLFLLLVGPLLGNFASGHPLAANKETRGVLGRGTAWQTSFLIRDSGNEGPVVLIVGGMHGNEPAGALAAAQIGDWEINRGKLVVIERANNLGLKAKMRWIPGDRNDSKARDLNRNFPILKKDAPVGELATAIWEFVKRQKPDWVLDLHEGFDFHSQNRKSVGSSVIAFPAERTVAAAIVESVNQQIPDNKKFSLLAGSGPVAGSLARACSLHLGARSLILETTFKQQPMSVRIRQHRQMVSHLLEEIGMLDRSHVDVVLDPKVIRRSRQQSTICVGVFDGPGANPGSVIQSLSANDRMLIRYLGPEDIRNVSLRPFHVLVFPGGSGSKQGKSLNSKGLQRVREFVKEGGGIVGICAGAYLCTSHYSWSLHLMNAKVYNEMVDIPGKGRKSMWYRGPAAKVDVECFAKAESILGLQGVHRIRYQNGPMLSKGTNPELPEFKVLARFRSENGVYEVQQGTMIHQPAVVKADYGLGKVIAISPHFESTPGKREVIANVIRSVKRSNPKQGR